VCDACSGEVSYGLKFATAPPRYFFHRCPALYLAFRISPQDTPQVSLVTSCFTPHPLLGHCLVSVPFWRYGDAALRCDILSQKVCSFPDAGPVGTITNFLRARGRLSQEGPPLYPPCHPREIGLNASSSTTYRWIAGPIKYN